MGGRYYITGVQLGTIRALASVYMTRNNFEIVELIDSIIKNQFVGDVNNIKTVCCSKCKSENIGTTDIDCGEDGYYPDVPTCLECGHHLVMKRLK